MNPGLAASADDFEFDDDAVATPAPGGPHRYSLIVDDATTGQRLDAFLAAHISTVSRARLRRAIDEGRASIDGAQQLKPSHRLSLGERVEVEVPAAVAGPQPDPIPLELLYEDEHLAAVNKPPGMVVHPAKGHWSGTLAGALVYHFGQLSGVGGSVRPGIVHRLDRDTSGVIVVAKTDSAHHALAQQFHDRTVQKEYLAIVAGSPDRDADRVSEPIGPHPTHRERMALRSDHPESRPAETFFEVVERFPGFALVRAKPKTGRTHQIRLHLAHLRTPVLCDKQYGSRSRLTLGELRGITRRKRVQAGAADESVLLERQALHAHRISFVHPTTSERVMVEAPLAADIRTLLEVLREAAAGR